LKPASTFSESLTRRVKKQVYELTLHDLCSFPVWEFRLDEFESPHEVVSLKPAMRFLKNLCGLIVALLKAFSSLVRLWVQPRDAARRRLEIERLDRIRHPWKYLGK